MFAKEFKSPFFWLIGYKHNASSSQSNMQRYFSRICIIVCIILISEAYLSKIGYFNDLVSIWAAGFLLISSITMFYWIIVLPPFVHGRLVNALRLFNNTIISSSLTICVFALWYRILGMNPSGTALDALYFSAVTFSTLGYGDFAPSPNARVFAAVQAILGNLHLGFIVGSTLLVTNK